MSRCSVIQHHLQEMAAYAAGMLASLQGLASESGMNRRARLVEMRMPKPRTISGALIDSKSEILRGLFCLNVLGEPY